MITTTLREDIADEFDWNQIETGRDDNNVLIYRATEYDNGLFRLQQYEDGTLRMVTQIDGDQIDDITGIKPWKSIETFYDTDGQLEARFEVRDTGVTILQTYEAGIRREKIQLDLTSEGGPSDTKSWERIEEYFDANGQRDVTFILADDGVTTLSQYEDGQLRSVVKEDLGAGGAPSDARSWERSETYYDQTGAVEARVQVADNGIEVVSEYEAGVRRVTTKMDRDETGNATALKSWDSIVSFYGSDGQIEARETIFDNGDVTAFFFEDGVRALRLQYDGDDSASWLVRETLYDASGQVVENNTYDTAAEVPPEYGFLDIA